MYAVIGGDKEVALVGGGSTADVGTTWDPPPLVTVTGFRWGAIATTWEVGALPCYEVELLLSGFEPSRFVPVRCVVPGVDVGRSSNFGRRRTEVLGARVPARRRHHRRVPAGEHGHRHVPRRERRTVLRVVGGVGPDGTTTTEACHFGHSGERFWVEADGVRSEVIIWPGPEVDVSTLLAV